MLALGTIDCGSGSASPNAGGGSAGTAGDGGGGTSAACPSCTAFVGGTVFDGEKATAATVVIDGERIVDVLPAGTRPSVGSERDISGKTLLPGLIDLHAHLRDHAGPWGYASPAFPYLEEHFRSLLRAGVTTVLDIGSDRDLIFELRARVRAGSVLAPDVLAVGSMITTTGGHPCYAKTPPGRTCVFVDAPADAARVSDLLIPKQPDGLKVVLSPPTLPSLSFESLKAIVDLGTAAEIPVLAHVATPENAVDAANAGVRALAHVPMYGVFSADQITVLAERKVAIIPTLAVNENLWELARGTARYDDPALADDVPAPVLSALREDAKSIESTEKQDSLAKRVETAHQNLKLAIAAGIEIAAGTDCGIAGTLHGPALRQELALYVAQGLSVADALRTATATPAKLLGLSDRGQITQGALADLLIVEGDASQSLDALARVVAVYRRGRAIDPASLALSQPSSVHTGPAPALAAGSACVFQRDCADQLLCDVHGVRCAEKCTFPGSGACPSGTACMNATDYAVSDYCRSGDGCAPSAQDCGNGAACVFTGNATTFCVPASNAGHDAVCQQGSCAAGNQCEPSTMTCKALCDPKAPSCPSGSSCLDASGFAGMQIGYCT